MKTIFVAGISTDVGKTVVCAILTTLLQGDYWKPIQCGQWDTDIMSTLVDTKKHCIFPSSYSLKAPFSPHHAARLEGVSIDVGSITPPHTKHPLVIEGCGGIFVPLTTKILSLDLFSSWECKWVVVSKHHLGCINHTLLTIDALKRKNVNILGLIFNGEENHDSESVILEQSQLPILGRLLPEREINSQTIQRYAKQWQKSLFH